MGEIKNTHGASSIEDRALAEGEDATAASSLRDGDPSHGLPNYAGRRDVDEACAAELNFASIEVGSYEFCREQGEVKTAIVGSLHGWSFKRAWRYWVATGPGIELSAAEALHEAHGRAVRVEGHCGCPSPREWNQGLATGHYHVDTLAGLKALADTIRDLVERAKTPAQAMEAEGQDPKELGAQHDSATPSGDVPESNPAIQAPSSTPGEGERLVNALVDACCRRHIPDARAARTALLSHISTAGRALHTTRAPQVSGIYTASKTKHADRWKNLRAEGWPINSTWIDEAGVGETVCFTNLWERCICEASQADAVLLYREPGDVLKGALVEAGAALSQGVPVYAIGCEEFSFSNAAGWVNCASVEIALEAIRKQLARPLTITIAASPISGLAALSAADATNPQDQE